MSRTALAFMSYVNDDDKYANGKITQFREHLSRAVKAHRGKPFEIFQDRDSINWGEQWQERINQSLDAVTFLIPIITPSFFNSAPCLGELERFLKREEELGRTDLILPVYYLNCPVLNDKEKLKHDPLAQIIAARQREDWRELRHHSFNTRKLNKALEKMARQIMVALERSETEASRLHRDKDSSTPASSNTFTKTGRGDQSIAQGANSIGTQINNYYASPPQDAKPQPAPAAKSGPPTVVVHTWFRGDYSTINKALKVVAPGTRILVRPGLYREGIVIDKPVEIIGDGERDEIVIEAYGKDVVLFKTDKGRMANLTLRQVGRGEWSGVNISKGRLELEDCDISSRSVTCVAIHGRANPLLRRCRIHDGSRVGVYVYENGQGTLEDNDIFANGLSGVAIASGHPTLRRNRITKNGGVGIYMDKDGGGIFEDNDLRGNGMGAWDIAPDCEANVQRRGNKE